MKRIFLTLTLLSAMIFSACSCEFEVGNLGDQTFDDPNYGYTFDYGDDWELRTDSTTFMVALKFKDSNAFLNIQNLLAQEAGGAYATLEDVRVDYKGQFENELEEVEYSNESTYSFTAADGSTVEGFQFTVSYKDPTSGEYFKQWQLGVARPEAPLFHTLAYTATASEFDMYMSEAQNVFESWKMQ